MTAYNTNSNSSHNSAHSEKFSKSVEEMERLWVVQLYREHAEIALYHRIVYKPTIIKIVETKSAWGQWDPFLRTISLSKRLIREHSWDVVLEILKHEMAHQYVTDCMGLVNETAHGISFKVACERVGVAPWAARATGEIPEIIPTLRERVLSREDERLLDRVAKLLSLAQSTNEHEALLAMERVRELYAKHNFAKLRQSDSAEAMDSMFVTRHKKKTDATETKILSILSSHFRVCVIHTHLYDSKVCTRFKAAEIMGRRENILMAEFVYHFLAQQCGSLWVAHKKLTKCPGSRRRSYQLGILAGFNNKLVQTQKLDEVASTALGMTSKEVMALIKMDKSEIDTFVGMRYPRISNKSWGTGSVDRESFESGQTAGRSLNLNKPMAKSESFGGFLS